MKESSASCVIEETICETFDLQLEAVKGWVINALAIDARACTEASAPLALPGRRLGMELDCESVLSTGGLSRKAEA